MVKVYWTVEKGSVTIGRANNNGEDTRQSLGDIIGEDSSLQFVPKEPYETDYDIKILKNEFNTTLTGINTESIGFIDLVGVTTTVGVGTTVSLIAKELNKTESIYASVEIINQTTSLRTVAELFLDHDGTDTFISESYFDNDSTTESSDNFIGTFKGNINSGVSL